MSLFKKMKQKVGDYLSDKKKSQVVNSKLKEIQDEFHLAKSSYDVSIMDEREKLFIGTHEVDPNANNTTTPIGGRKLANNVVNVIYELIESQIDTTIPMPSVYSKTKRGERLAQIIENCIKNNLQESDIYRINDENERTTPVQGFSLISVDWNPDYKHHLYRGEIELDNKHPKLFIPQSGIYELQKMDYFFVMSSVSIPYIKKRYGIELQDQGEEYPDINTISGESDNNENNENVTMITKWYKDDDGDVCKFTWANDTVLEDLPKYFARRVDGEIQEYEILDKDIVLTDGNILPKMSDVLDENGEPTGKKEPTKIKYFMPTTYPFIMRKNVPLAYNFGGQSDIDVIRDQADAIKKVVSIIEEKIIKGGTIIKALDDHKFELTNDLYKIIRGELPQLSALSVMDLQANIQQDLQFVVQQYQSAQNTLGITDSFQGKPDKTATSGVAKQIQIQQTSGRMQSKLFNKQKAFKDLFRVMFEFKLAFYDEYREFMVMNYNNEPLYETFNKYDFVERDIAGEYYYNTDFIFSSDAGDGIPKDKMWLMNQANIFVQQGLMSKVQFWSSMEKLGYPNASQIKKQAIEEEKQAQEMAQKQAEMEQQRLDAELQIKAQKVKNDSEKNKIKAVSTSQDNQRKIQEAEFNRQLETAKILQADKNNRENVKTKGGNDNG